MDLKNLVGKKISVLIEGLEGKIENDVGTVEDWDGDYLTLKLENPNFNVEKIILRKDIIRSIWIYKGE